ncbi:BAG family molecular chaperone regulator 2 isoform X2 [Ctenocephalides felis]|nr:BAG family molecular chaperone regulator 2 isoform X2 [Ctenocephalides felis]
MEVEGSACIPPNTETNIPGPSSPSALTGLPRIDEAESDPAPPKERFFSLLDQLENHVERLRREAARLEEERDGLLATLDSLKNSESMSDLDEYEKDEVIRYCDRVLSRCHTIELTIRTNRDIQQEEALHQVNAIIDNIVLTARSNWNESRTKCESFLNACISQPGGPVDKTFEKVILGCALDDQKKIKKRLQGLIDYFDKMSQM